MKRRYCEMCDVWTNQNPCKECGASTSPAESDPREKDDDDGREYADPRDRIEDRE